MEPIKTGVTELTIFQMKTLMKLIGESTLGLVKKFIERLSRLINDVGEYVHDISLITEREKICYCIRMPITMAYSSQSAGFIEISLNELEALLQIIEQVPLSTLDYLDIHEAEFEALLHIRREFLSLQKGILSGSGLGPDEEKSIPSK